MENDTQQSKGKSDNNTERQLKRLLNIQQETVPTGDEQERRTLSKRRRLSVSRSTTSSRSEKKPKTEKAYYTCPSKIAEIFNWKISSDSLCALSAAEDGTPSLVREVMPRASIKQICQMCKLWEDNDERKSGSGTRLSKSRRSKLSVSRQDRERSDKQSRPRKPVLTKMREIKSRKKTKSGELDLFGNNFPVPSPTEGT